MIHGLQQGGLDRPEKFHLLKFLWRNYIYFFILMIINSYFFLLFYKCFMFNIFNFYNIFLCFFERSILFQFCFDFLIYGLTKLKILDYDLI
jgi:hypothetical protein